ncbi:hypothetical protein M9H77_12569 [Catharanthus roseus]|uniref:Uncharacterized protein n=1 Tax=Catharanthus roseus TaxID=4058 RepID=A0ACC0BHT1_CATRO|nr:hypothetical protein M9H77_12569 [Catharanthus roseus]
MGQYAKQALRSAHRALQFETPNNNAIILVDKKKEEYQDTPEANPPFIPHPMVERTMTDYAQPSITEAQLSITRPPKPTADSRSRPTAWGRVLANYWSVMAPKKPIATSSKRKNTSKRAWVDDSSLKPT